MTNVLSVVRHRERCKPDFNLDAMPVASIMTHTVLCRHAGWQSLEGGRGGKADEVFSCSCATAHLLSKLIVCQSQDNVLPHDKFRKCFSSRLLTSRSQKRRS